MKKSFANYLSVLVEDLFFSPEDQVYWSPEHAGLNGQKLPTLSDEGTVLRLTKPNIEAKGSVIYFHDGSKNLTAHIPETAWLCELGLEVYLFDIRESEDDKGFPIEFSGNFIGAYGALENVSKASEQAAGLILHNCPYSFRSYMLANYGPGLGQAMSALLASDYQDPSVLVSEIKDVPIVVTYQNTGRLPISEFDKFRKTELPNLSYIEFPAKAPAQTVNKEAEELRERIIKFFDTRTTS